MSSVAAALKVVALSLAFLCVGSARPHPAGGVAPVTRTASSAPLECRMYFGCKRAASPSLTAAQQQEYVR